MKYYATIAVFFLAFAFSPARAQTPAPPAIRLPSTAVVTPTPSSAPQKLTADVWFAFDADVDCLVLFSPAQHLKMTKEEGPIRIRGKFVDGDGKVETRTFKGKYVFILEPVVSGKCEILVVPPGVKEDGVLRRMLDVQAGEGPRPPPDPPKPDPVDPPNPLTVTFQAAYDADRTDVARAAHLGSMTEIMGIVVEKAKSSGRVTTFAAMEKVVKDTTDNAIGTRASGSLPKLREAIGAYLSSKLGTADKPLTAELWESLAKEYGAVATALKGVK